MESTTCPGCGESFEPSDSVCPACHRCLVCGRQGTAEQRPECGHTLESMPLQDASAIDRIPELLAQREERLAEAGKSAVKTAVIVAVRGMSVAWTLFLVVWNSMPPRDFGLHEAVLRASSVLVTGILAVILVSSAEDRVSVWGALAVIMVCVQVLPLFAWAFWVGT